MAFGKGLDKETHTYRAVACTVGELTSTKKAVFAQFRAMNLERLAVKVSCVTNHA